MPLSVCICQSIGPSVCLPRLAKKKEKKENPPSCNVELRGGFCSSCPASWKQMSEAEAVFHGCFKAFPGSLQFVCHAEIKSWYFVWHVDALHAAAESAQKKRLFSFLSHETQI